MAKTKPRRRRVVINQASTQEDRGGNYHPGFHKMRKPNRRLRRA